MKKAKICCKEYKYCIIGAKYEDFYGLHLVDETAYEKYEDEDYESFEKFNFCPNCGKEIK